MTLVPHVLGREGATGSHGTDKDKAQGGAERLTLMYCRSVSALTLKSDTYWPRMELLSWLLLPPKDTMFERSTRSG